MNANIEYERFGIKEQCISSSDLVAMMRKIAKKQGKPVEIMEATDKPRWAKAIAKWTLIIVALSFLIGMLTSVGRADEITVKKKGQLLVFSLSEEKIKGCPAGYYCVPKWNLETIVDTLNTYSTGIEELRKIVAK